MCLHFYICAVRCLQHYIAHFITFNIHLAYLFRYTFCEIDSMLHLPKYLVLIINQQLFYRVSNHLLESRTYLSQRSFQESSVKDQKLQSFRFSLTAICTMKSQSLPHKHQGMTSVQKANITHTADSQSVTPFKTEPQKCIQYIGFSWVVCVCVVEIPGPRKPAAYVIPVVTPGLGRCLLWSGLGCLLAPCSPEYSPELQPRSDNQKRTSCKRSAGNKEEFKLHRESSIG